MRTQINFSVPKEVYAKTFYSRRDIPGFVWDIPLAICIGISSIFNVWDTPQDILSEYMGYPIRKTGISRPIRVKGYPLEYHIVVVGISPIYVWDIPLYIPHLISMRISHRHRHVHMTILVVSS